VHLRFKSSTNEGIFFLAKIVVYIRHLYRGKIWYLELGLGGLQFVIILVNFSLNFC
jgi:hypothetical protein